MYSPGTTWVERSPLTFTKGASRVGPPGALASEQAAAMTTPSGAATRDTIPSHLLVGKDVSGPVADFLSHVCPAGVYERVGDELRVNPPQLRGLQGHRRARPALDAAGGRERAQVPLDVGPVVCKRLRPGQALASAVVDGHTAAPATPVLSKS